MRLQRRERPKRGNSWLLYTTSDEDSESEVKALQISPSDVCLSVTGSACRSLSLLACEPRKLISVDACAEQNYLLEFKLAALCELPPKELFGFLGIEDDSRRDDAYEVVRERLSPGARSYFDVHRWAVRAGIVFSGRHEYFYQSSRGLVDLLFRRKFDRVFGARDVAEQGRLYESEIAGPLWNGVTRLGCSQLFYRHVLKDPSYFAHVTVGSVADYLLPRLHHTFTHHLARENHWISFLIYGRYLGERCVPHYLYREHVPPIRAAAERLEIATADLLQFLRAQPSDSIDKFSLSDVSGWMSDEVFRAILSEVVRTGRSGGRVCYRNFLTKRAIPAELRSVLRRDDALCAQLERDDRAFAFSFEASTIDKSRAAPH